MNSNTSKSKTFLTSTASHNTSGSNSSIKSLYSFNNTFSESNEYTFTPGISAQVFKQNIFWTIGSGFPNSVHIFAIWITGSLLAVGKCPCLAAHSISNERIRKGAIFENSPSTGNDLIFL